MVVADAEVSLEGIQEEKSVLNDDRFVQAQVPPHFLHIGGGSIRRHEKGNGVSGDVQDGKNDPAYHQENDDRLVKTPEDIETHGPFPAKNDKKITAEDGEKN